jgi:hypothetical protein
MARQSMMSFREYNQYGGLAHSLMDRRVKPGDDGGI